MIEVLLINDRFYDCIKVNDCINSLSDQVRLYKIINNNNNIIDIINNQNVNIIIINYKIFKNIDFLKIKNNEYFWVILWNSKINKSNGKCFFTNYCNLKKTLLNILPDIDVLKKEEKKIKDKIRKELNYLGYNQSYNGTKYLIDCIYYMYKKYNTFDDNYIKDIYPILAKKYKKTINSIKCNITYATSIMICECEEKKLKKYIGICSIPKTGSKIIIETILNKINSITV